jgi:hypothetical protein
MRRKAPHFLIAPLARGVLQFVRTFAVGLECPSRSDRCACAR